MPTSTTSHVRSRLGPKLINEMIPAIERALKATNLILQAGGMSLVTLDLADAPVELKVEWEGDVALARFRLSPDT